MTKVAPKAQGNTQLPREKSNSSWRPKMGAIAPILGAHSHRHRHSHSQAGPGQARPDQTTLRLLEPETVFDELQESENVLDEPC